MVHLVDGARAAAREEAHHAELCFELASRYGGGETFSTATVAPLMASTNKREVRDDEAKLER